MRGTKEEIKERLSIVDVVSPYVKLTRAGRSLKGLCPFHKEKTPSFHVSPERGTYHCFGCGEGGDIFSFIQKVEGIDFKDALTMLAEKAGVTLHFDGTSSEQRTRLDRVKTVMARALAWYAAGFAGSPSEAYAYGRGISEESVALWQLGYAPDSWRGLLDALTGEGYTVQELLSAGLIKEADGKPGTYYDRFRSRLMFPIRDATGHAVAFTGRVLGPALNEQEPRPAKYLNSPETDLYHKSEILFGMDRAKDAIRLRGFTLLVEGQMDVLLAHQAGFANAVALSGTALSLKHLALMKRYSENLLLVLDADAAGLSATAKSAHLALSAGMRVKAALLPEGMDPADLVGRDPKEFSACIKEARPIVEFFLAALAARERDQGRLVRSAEGLVLPLIAAMASPMEREHFAAITARALGLSTETVRESLSRIARERVPVRTGVAEKVPEPIPIPGRSPRELREEQVLAVLHAYPETLLAKRVTVEYSRITGQEKPSAQELSESVIFHIEQLFGEHPEERAADELLYAFEKAVIREAYQGAVVQLRRAEAQGEIEEIERSANACAQLSARLSALGD